MEEERSLKRKVISPSGVDSATNGRPIKRNKAADVVAQQFNGLQLGKGGFIFMPKTMDKEATKVTVDKTMDHSSKKDTDLEDGSEEEAATYIVVSGRLKDYEVVIVPGSMVDNNSKVKVLTVKNARGKEMRDPVSHMVLLDSLREKDSYDMLEFSQDVDDANEDKALLKHEQETWQCPKCDAFVSNENGFCPKIIDGKPCGSAPRAPEGGYIGWGGCTFITQHMASVSATFGHSYY